MPAALPIASMITQGSTRTRKNRVLSAQFGDGYSQELPDGTNAKYDEWEIKYDNLNSSERTTLWNVLDTVGNWDYVTWTAPGDNNQKKWKIRGDVSEVPISGDMYNVSFTIKQVF